jgi:hypothetical protein
MQSKEHQFWTIFQKQHWTAKMWTDSCEVLFYAHATVWKRNKKMSTHLSLFLQPDTNTTIKCRHLQHEFRKVSTFLPENEGRSSLWNSDFCKVLRFVKTFKNILWIKSKAKKGFTNPEPWSTRPTRTDLHLFTRRRGMIHPLKHSKVLRSFKIKKRSQWIKLKEKKAVI